MKNLFVALSVAATSAIVIPNAVADEIVILRDTKSNRCIGYEQPGSFESTDPETEDPVTYLYEGGRYK